MIFVYTGNYWNQKRYYVKVKNDDGFGMRLYIFLVFVCYDCLMFIQQQKKDAHLEDCHKIEFRKL